MLFKSLTKNRCELKSISSTFLPFNISNFRLFSIRHFYIRLLSIFISTFLPFDIFPFRPKLGLPKILSTNMFSYSTDILRVKLFEIFFFDICDYRDFFFRTSIFSRFSSSNIHFFEILIFEHPFFRDFRLRTSIFSRFSSSKYGFFEISIIRDFVFSKSFFSAIFFEIYFFGLISFDLSTLYLRSWQIVM